MQTKDWAIIVGYAVGVLTALSSAAAPQLIDSLLGVFGIPPGIGTKIALVAGSLLALGTLIYSKINNTTTIAAAAQSGPSSAAIPPPKES